MRNTKATPKYFVHTDKSSKWNSICFTYWNKLVSWNIIEESIQFQQGTLPVD